MAARPPSVEVPLQQGVIVVDIITMQKQWLPRGSPSQAARQVALCAAAVFARPGGTVYSRQPEPASARADTVQHLHISSAFSLVSRTPVGCHCSGATPRHLTQNLNGCACWRI